jgi:hypothetical protein
MPPAFPGGIWFVDFEFQPRDGREGNVPLPVCMVALEMTTGAAHRFWRDDLERLPDAPFPVGDSALFVAYMASAEMGCFRALGWPAPSHILDLYAEFRTLTNGLALPAGRGLIGALAYFGEPTIEATAKESMRDLVLRGEPWSPEERQAIMDYCESDVEALARLFARMCPPGAAGLIDWPRALHRGRYGMAAAAAEFRGIPIDAEIYDLLRERGPSLRQDLIDAVDPDFGVFEQGHFRQELFGQFLARVGIAWPRTAQGKLELADDAFREMARAHPQLTALHQLRQSLVQLRDLKLSIGDDGRNRYPLFPFSSKTGRNQPSTSQSVFGLSNWMRGMIRPEIGSALAYVDFSQQELAIAAALSGDPAMQAAYRSGDFYMTFAIQAGAAPAGATKASHPEIRERFKQCALGVLFGMEDRGLARRLGISVLEARRLLGAHRQAYATFWRWSDEAVAHAQFRGKMKTVFGWTLHLSGDPNARSLRNFPMQANGAEMLRLASIDLDRCGIRVCAPVHDAVLIEAPADQIDAAVADTRAIMRRASAIVLDGFEVGADARVIRFPDRLLEPKGIAIWNRVMGLIGRDDAIVARSGP